MGESVVKMSVQYTIAPPAEALEKVGGRGRIGLVALATDVNSESDLRRMAPEGVEIFTNRVANENPVTAKNLRAMAPDITRAAAGILPGDDLDVLVYSCTSGTAVIGEEEVTRLLQAGRRGDGKSASASGALPCTNPITAVLQALRAFSARRISVLTPYTEAVNRELVEALGARGVEVLNVHGFGIASDADMGCVSHNSIVEAARGACRAEADLLFISCTALRAAEVIAQVEGAIGKPAICSNQAMMWHALKLLRRPFQVSGFGELFAR